MDATLGRAHSLEGLSAASLDFLRALDRNRHRIAKKANVSASELRALFRIAEVVRITPKALAELLSMTTGAITAISTRLVEGGLIQRVDNPTDRRSLYLELTSAAHLLMEEIHRDFMALIEDSAHVLGARERAQLTSSLSALAAELDIRTSIDPVS
jgi:DNA-binding MarR family transcriptional regulator